MRLTSRSAVFRDFTKLRLVVCYRRFGATCWSHYAA